MLSTEILAEIRTQHSPNSSKNRSVFHRPGIERDIFIVFLFSKICAIAQHCSVWHHVHYYDETACDISLCGDSTARVKRVVSSVWSETCKFRARKSVVQISTSAARGGPTRID